MHQSLRYWEWQAGAMLLQEIDPGFINRLAVFRVLFIFRKAGILRDMGS